jgi:hypothetical protein
MQYHDQNAESLAVSLGRGKEGSVITESIGGEGTLE